MKVWFLMFGVLVNLLGIRCGTSFQFLTNITSTMKNKGIEDDRNTSRTYCVVQTHDKIRGYLNWLQDWFVATSRRQNIQIVEGKDGFGKGSKFPDVIIFHAPTHEGKIGSNIRNKFRDSVFAMVSMEQPNYATVLQNLKYLQKNMDLMVTYSLSSTYPGTTVPNLPITYYPTHIFSPEAVLQPSPFTFQQKDGYGTGISVVLFTSNCKLAGATQRLKYLEELMRHIDVHSYGKCLNNRKEPQLPDDPAWPAIAQRRARKVKVLSHYKFYLAFENAPIDDYVSEKVFEGLFAGSVPVYRGSRSIQKFMPSDDSFIDANELTPIQLATMLKDIANSQTKYDSYFEFKKRPLSEQFQSIAAMSYVHPNVLSRICDSAQQHKRESKTIH